MRESVSIEKRQQILKEFLSNNVIDLNIDSLKLYNFGRHRKQIYLSLLNWSDIHFIVKFYKKNLQNLFEQEIVNRNRMNSIYAPKVYFDSYKIEETQKWSKFLWTDHGFFIEDFIQGPTLDTIISNPELNNRGEYVDSAIWAYKEVLKETIEYDFILKSANPKNIIFKDSNLDNPVIIDWTAQKDISGSNYSDIKTEYQNMLQTRIINPFSKRTSI